jgi:hypothetical protein
MMTDWYVLDGHEPRKVGSLEEYARSGAGPVHVGDTAIGDVRVSTIFLGLDHAHGYGPPMLFETMIFGGQYNDYYERCSTWEQAEAQHAAAISLVRSTLQ